MLLSPQKRHVYIEIYDLILHEINLKQFLHNIYLHDIYMVTFFKQLIPSFLYLWWLRFRYFFSFDPEPAGFGLLAVVDLWAVVVGAAGVASKGTLTLKLEDPAEV